MSEKETERRAFKRVEFNLEDGIMGHFILPDDGSIVSPILNLSAGGLQFYLAVEAIDKVEVGDTLLLKGILGTAFLDFLSNIELQTLWKKKRGTGEYYALGCEIQKIPQNSLEQLSGFVDSERMSRGQYD